MFATRMTPRPGAAFAGAGRRAKLTRGGLSGRSGATGYPVGVRRDEGTVARSSVQRRFDWVPWILFLLLAGSVWFFWVQPLREGPPPVQVEFEKADG